MAFANLQYLDRRRKLSARVAALRVDSYLVTHPTNVRYLTGFTGSNAALLVNKDLSAAIATDGRYTSQIAEEVGDIEPLITRHPAEDLLKEVPSGRRVGYDSARTTVAELKRLEAVVPAGVTLVAMGGSLESLREIKDANEIARLEEAAQISVDALAGLLEAGELRAGRSEREVAADLEYRMRLLGAERFAFDTIVASGPNSALPHHAAGDRVIEDGDLVTLDFGAYYRGYNSDMTRTFCVGHATEWAKEIYGIVLEAQLAGVEASTPGTMLTDIDAACRDIITDAGYGEYFVHSTGHGVGMDVHEEPAARSIDTGPLLENSTLTIEPGIYVPGKGGVRIEDTLVITSGAPRVITPAPKELTVVGG